MKLIFRGAAREVGRSCIEVQTAGDRYLLDFGIKFVKNGFDYPQDACNKQLCDVHKIDGVLLSHAHLDHTGSLPILEHRHLVAPIFCTHQTIAIARLLLRDSYKIAHIKHLDPAYTKTDIREVRKKTHRCQFDKWYQHRKIKFMFLNAGHIPGSASILFEVEGKRVIYTGDFNTRTTKLMMPADLAGAAQKYGPIDCLITESTYGHRVLPPRDKLEQELITEIKRVIGQGGSVLLPVFAVGRAQEILIMLANAGIDCSIYFDGMAKEMTRSILVNQSTYVTNKDILHDMYFNKVQLVTSNQTRMRAANDRPAIYVSTSGMMQGGPAILYLQQLWADPKSAVFMTGYQVVGTNGRRLLEEGFVYIDGEKTDVRCEVRKFDFSGHADIEDVKAAIEAVGAKTVIFQHGDDESVQNMVDWAEENLDATVYGPHLEDEIEL